MRNRAGGIETLDDYKYNEDDLTRVKSDTAGSTASGTRDHGDTVGNLKSNKSSQKRRKTPGKDNCKGKRKRKGKSTRMPPLTRQPTDDEVMLAEVTAVEMAAKESLKNDNPESKVTRGGKSRHSKQTKTSGKQSTKMGDTHVTNAKKKKSKKTTKGRTHTSGAVESQHTDETYI